MNALKNNLKINKILFISLFFNCFLIFFNINFVSANCSGTISVDEHGGIGNDFEDGIDGPYIDNSDGTVTDLGKKLMWQQTDDSDQRDWQSACTYCETLTLAGYDDWELPDIYKLESLLDDNDSSHINSDYFYDTQTSRHWSGSTLADVTDGAWDVNFSDGSVGGDDYTKADANYVRCVRYGTSEPIENLVISVDANPENGDAPLDISLSCTIISGTPPYIFSWDFGDAGSDDNSQPNVSHQYLTAGTYTATCTVTDHSEQIQTASVDITVTDPLPEFCIVNVTVSDVETEERISGANINFISPEFENEYQTNENGNYNITDIPAGTYRVVISVEGYQNEIYEPLTLTSGTTRDLAIFLEPIPDLVISVDANPENGDAPLDISLSCTIISGTPPYIFSWDFGDAGSDDNSQPNVSHQYLTAGTYTATCTVTDHSEQIQTASVDITVTDPLPEFCIVNVTVSDVETEERISGANINFISPEFENEYQTNENGNYNITDIPAGTYRVVISAKGYQNKIYETLTLTFGTPQELAISLKPNELVPDLVISVDANPKNGDAPLDISLSCTVISGTPPYIFSWDFGDGEKGTGEKISHTYFESRVYQVVVTGEDINGKHAVDTFLMVVTDPDTGQDQVCTVHGRIYDSKTGQAINKVQLIFTSKNLTKRYQTDNDGTINITNIPVGVYNAHITAQGYQEMKFENLSLTQGIIFDITTALESSAPEIIKIWSEPDVAAIVNNLPAEVIIYAKVTDPDTIEDIKSVRLSLLTNNLDFRLRNMEPMDTQNGIYQFKINIPPNINIGHYALGITAQDYSKFKDYSVIDFRVIKQITKKIEPAAIVRETIDNILHNQALIFTVEVTKTMLQKKERFNSLGSGSDCYVEVNVYDPNGEFYGSYKIYETMDIEIPNAMEGEWIYENINHCLETVDVQIEIKGSDTGIIRGTIKDSSTNTGILNAEIDWNMGGKIVSDSDGNFSFVAIAGTGVLITTSAGYKNNLRTNIYVPSGEITTVTVKLVSDTLSPLLVPDSPLSEIILNPMQIPDPEVQPLGAGVENDNLNISACFAPYETPVSIYLGITSDYPEFVPYFFLFNKDNQLEAMGDTVFAWRKDSSVWNQIELLSISTKLLPKANYTFYSLVTDDPVTWSTFDFKYFTIKIE